MTDLAHLRQLEARLDRLESEGAIRACINRYMFLCDYLDARTPLDELAGLFTVDAVWEGIGEKYKGTFGRIEGREAIAAMERWRFAPQATATRGRRAFDFKLD